MLAYNGLRVDKYYLTKNNEHHPTKTMKKHNINISNNTENVHIINLHEMPILSIVKVECSNMHKNKKKNCSTLAFNKSPV